MTISIQGLIVFAVVSLAASYVGYSAWQTLNGKKTGCSCGIESCDKQKSRADQ